MRVSKTMSRLVGAMWDIFFEIAAICLLVLVLVIAFATCMTVSMGHNDLLFATFGTSGKPHCTACVAACNVIVARAIRAVV